VLITLDENDGDSFLFPQSEELEDLRTAEDPQRIQFDQIGYQLALASFLPLTVGIKAQPRASDSLKVQEGTEGNGVILLRSQDKRLHDRYLTWFERCNRDRCGHKKIIYYFK
jgi:hypothetical protein